MKNDASSFWVRVDSLLRQRNINIGEMCLRTNISYNTLITQRTRKSIPKIEQLCDMAKALNTSLDYLVTGQEYQDELFAELQKDKELKDTCSKISLCSNEHLSIINTMLASWGYIVSEETLNKGLA